MELKDAYGRPVTSLRISVTNRCNLECVYCHNEGELREEKKLITPETVYKIVKIAASYGVRRVKFSGGEPLLRDDFADIVHAISDVSGLREISLTTNGILLGEQAHQLAEAGLSRVNVSLDSLNEETYMRVSGAPSGTLSEVLKGIESAVDAGLTPVKLNMVLLKDINDREITDMIEFVRSTGLILQLIELMDFKGIPQYKVDMAEVEAMLSSRADSTRTRRMQSRRKYFVDGAEVEVVQPIDNSEFCANCTRLRVTSDGKLKTCLLRNDDLIDINGMSEDEMREAYKLAVSRRRPFCIGSEQG